MGGLKFRRTVTLQINIMEIADGKTIVGKGANLCWALGGNLQFFLIFNIGGMNLDHNFFSDEQIKWRPQKKKKKRSSPEMEHFFPPIQVEPCAQMHTRVKLLEGMQMKTILKLFGGIQSNYWGEYIPPGFRHPWL